MFFRPFAGGRGTITLNIASFKCKLGNFDEAMGYTFACRAMKSENIVTWNISCLLQIIIPGRTRICLLSFYILGIKAESSWGILYTPR